MVTESESFE